MEISTFSIVAHDPEVPAWGIAVASRFLAVGSVVPWARANAGAVATQAFANTTYGPAGLAMMENRMAAGEILEMLVARDEERDRRQVGLVDSRGNSATYTGAACKPWAGGQTGNHFAVQGNLLAGPQVIEAMVAAFEEATGELPRRLYAALLAGDRAGGDRRGRQSAAILVVREGSGYGNFNDRWVDYRVDNHPDPVAELGSILEMHTLYKEKSPVDERVPLDLESLKTLQAIMTQHGFYQGPVNGQFDTPTQTALEQFTIHENLRDRTHIEEGSIDPPALSYLLSLLEG